MNCFLLRLPHSEKLYAGYSEILTDKPAHGFIFSLFGQSETVYYIPFVDKPVDYRQFDKWVTGNDREYLNKAGKLKPSTQKEQHLNLVKRCIERINQLESATGENAKIIASRVCNIPTSLSPTEIFNNLAAKYPESTIFLFSTTHFGTWIGATPEVVLLGTKKDGVFEISSVSLAGTRKASFINTPWDHKNIEEQRIVTLFIADTFRRNGITPEVCGPEEKRYGPVIHLQSAISGRANSQLFADNKNTEDKEGQEIKLYLQLLASLTPTPAVSGYPQKEALEFIERSEPHNRQCYGGIIGLYYPNGNIKTYATLRCGQYSAVEKSILLYAGGGITHDSIPEDEWEETEIKLSTIKSVL